jgi:hypothetical protein
VGAFQEGNDFTGNDVDFVSVQTGGGIHNIRGDATWRSMGVPYRVLPGAPNELTVEQHAVLRIAPGVEVRFGAGVGFSILQGSLLAVMGTTQNPVTLRGDDAKWRGIHVHDASAYLDHVAIDDAGSARWSGARQPGAVTLTASNGGTSRVTFTSSVSNGGAPYGTVFTAGNTYSPPAAWPPFSSRRPTKCPTTATRRGWYSRRERPGLAPPGSAARGGCVGVGASAGAWRSERCRQVPTR